MMTRKQIVARSDMTIDCDYIDRTLPKTRQLVRRLRVAPISADVGLR